MLLYHGWIVDKPHFGEVREPISSYHVEHVVPNDDDASAGTVLTVDGFTGEISDYLLDEKDTVGFY